MTKAKTLTDSAYSRLRQDIISGYLPPEQKLKIEHLKKEYEVGATPIREALSRLSSDGFVVTEGQRGFQTAPISVEDLYDITELRITLELKAVRKSIEQGDDKWESNLVGAFFQLTKAEQNKGQDEDSLKEWEIRNKDFHNALLDACNSQLLIRFYKILYDQHKRYRNIALTAKTVTNQSRDLHAEHERIFNAAIARDADTACEEIEKHIRNTAEVTQQIILEQLGESE